MKKRGRSRDCVRHTDIELSALYKPESDSEVKVPTSYKPTLHTRVDQVSICYRKIKMERRALFYLVNEYIVVLMHVFHNMLSWLP